MLPLCETPEQVLRQEDVLILGQTKLGAVLLALLKFQLIHKMYSKSTGRARQDLVWMKR